MSVIPAVISKVLLISYYTLILHLVAYFANFGTMYSLHRQCVIETVMSSVENNVEKRGNRASGV